MYTYFITFQKNIADILTKTTTCFIQLCKFRYTFAISFLTRNIFLFVLASVGEGIGSMTEFTETFFSIYSLPPYSPCLITIGKIMLFSISKTLMQIKGCFYMDYIILWGNTATNMSNYTSVLYYVIYVINIYYLVEQNIFN